MKDKYDIVRQANEHAERYIKSGQEVVDGKLDELGRQIEPQSLQHLSDSRKLLKQAEEEKEILRRMGRGIVEPSGHDFGVGAMADQGAMGPQAQDPPIGNGWDRGVTGQTPLREEDVIPMHKPKFSKE